MDAQSQDGLVAEYDLRKPVFDKLCEEVLYGLKNELFAHGIKYHSMDGRVKTKDSFIEKLQRKLYSDPFNDVQDLVGVRVICLFIADLPVVGDIVRSMFSVRTEDDKIFSQEVNVFGYMSQHFVCELAASSSGPRYDNIKDIAFEVQVRTILMDAWANISHHLAYKGDASIPDHLQRDFHALSGLFYVADRHFQLFYEESQESKAQAKITITQLGGENARLDRDTTLALFQELYPHRKHAEPESVSEFVEEILPFGYTTVGDLRPILESFHQAALRYELENPPSIITANEQVSEDPDGYKDVGIARATLAIADSNYCQKKYDDDKYTEFR